MLQIIGELNADPAIHGILVQMPVPPQIRPEAVVESIDPRKDVDGLHPFNAGRLFSSDPSTRPARPPGSSNSWTGTESPSRGGRPLSWVGATSSASPCPCCFWPGTPPSRSAIPGPGSRSGVPPGGDPGSCGGQSRDDPWRHGRDGAVVIDVGINRVEGRLLGDVSFQEAEPRASWITPVARRRRSHDNRHAPGEHVPAAERVAE